MCINPGKLADGTEIACRECWRCRENRINDWVGRCIAESKTAVKCSSIELTYGRDQYGSADHPSAVVLTYSDVQKYFKLLRFHGYPCRYFVVGEFGKEKGRAHWHLIVYWLKRVPPFAGFDQYGKWSNNWKATRFNHQRLDDAGKPALVDGKPSFFWKHGWSYVEPISFASVRYKMKYIQKDIGDMERQGHLSMSKKPPLGSEYFRMEAERYVEAGLSPRSLIYTFDEARNSKGEKVQFMLRGKTADIFLEHFIATWEKRRPGRHWPVSQLVDEFHDKPRTDQKIEEALADMRFDQKWASRLEHIDLAKNAPFVGGVHNSRKYMELGNGQKKGQ